MLFWNVHQRKQQQILILPCSAKLLSWMQRHLKEYIQCRVIFYSPQLFISLGKGQTAALIATIVTGVVNHAATYVSLWTADHKGRQAFYLPPSHHALPNCVLILATFSSHHALPWKLPYCSYKEAFARGRMSQVQALSLSHKNLIACALFNGEKSLLCIVISFCLIGILLKCIGECATLMLCLSSCTLKLSSDCFAYVATSVEEVDLEDLIGSNYGQSNFQICLSELSWKCTGEFCSWLEEFRCSYLW